METLLIVVLILTVLLIIANSKKKTTELDCIVEHSDRDESYLSYYDKYSKLHQETDGCNDCIRARAEQLQAERDVRLIRVVYGKRNTGEL